MKGKRGGSPGPSQAPTKRAKSLRDPTNYARGAVMKIRVHNFMTYKDAEIAPGPRLNVVLGPNGTGKSSLVCALCVGLGGSTKLLGRADNVKDFIRRGESEGWVEITLSAGPRAGARPIVVTRFMRDDGSTQGQSRWKLNGGEATLKAVKEKIADLNIQLENLCQFLPQDKVVEFAKLKPAELLEETQRAFGSAEMYERHQQLKEKKKALIEEESKKEALEKKLEKLERDSSAQERDVKRFQDRERLLEEVKVIGQKLKWMSSEALKQRLDETRSALTSCRSKVKAAQKKVKGAEQPVKVKAEELAAARAELGARNSVVKDVERKLNGHTYGKTLMDHIQDKSEEVEAQLEALDNLGRDSARQAQELANLRRQLADAQRRWDEFPAPREGIPEEVARVNDALSAADRQRREISLELQNLLEEQQQKEAEVTTYEGRLRQLQSAKAQRMRQLEARFGGVRAQADWVAANRDRFRGPVLGPLALEVEISEPLHAVMLEQHCPGHVWRMFVVEHEEDQRLLISEMYNALRTKPVVTHFAGDKAAPIAYPNGEAAQYAQYGITATLDSVFDAPPIVKHVLCSEAGLNTTYVGNHQVDANLKALQQDCPQVSALYTPTTVLFVKTSIYNRSANLVSMSALREGCRLLGADATTSKEEREECELCLASVRQELEGVVRRVCEGREQLRGVEAREDEARANRDALEKEQRDHRQRKAKLQSGVRSLAAKVEIQAAIPDPRSKEPAIRDKIAQLNAQCLQMVQQVVALTRQQWAAMQAKAVADLHVKELEMQHAALRRSCEDTRAELERLHTMERSLCRILKDDEEKLKEYTGFTVSAELKDKFEALPSDEAELDALRESKVAEAEGIVCSNPGVMEQYRTRKAEMGRLTQELELAREMVETQQAELVQLKEAWLPELRKMVGYISAAFSDSFAGIGAAGEVHLVEDPHENFNNYAIEIKVKFRESELLQTLTANRQSGGERSVSTILYLIAIQGVTDTPFRVVDEINQGMDPRNERKVFDQLVDAATQAHTPQCFLLTPKLLPGLNFSHDVTVLQIMNGPLVAEVAAHFTAEKLYGARLVEAC